MSLDKAPKRDVLSRVDYTPPATGWMETPVDFRPGTWSYSGIPRALEYLDMPNPRKWQPSDDDWQLPDNWKQILIDGIAERLDKYRSFRLFMDICVRCGACADKCHFFLGSGDPKNMPVLRAELLRAVYRKEFTLAGKLLGKYAGARELDYAAVKEWFYYFFQCTECRRCSVFCPYGIDTAEITIIGRELLNLIGCNINWVMEPVANCFRTGNHLGIQPHTFVDNVDFAADDLSDVTGVKVDISYNRKGAEVLFVVPSADYFGEPHIYTFMGYLALLHEIGLDYTFTTFAGEGGNFGLFTSHEMMKRLNAKIYGEARRLGVKWILGGECGHMWRVLHQYMETMNGPAPENLEVPKSPITGTVFENARSTKMVHICEFTADLLHHNKLKFDKSRNDHRVVTFHDSCNPARAMGLLEEPRICIKASCNKFYEMPENAIREQTFCCGSGSGLGNDENLEMRLRGGFPRGNALRTVHDKFDVNTMACICAIDKATLPALAEYWVGGVDIAGVHELVGNALILSGEKQRTQTLRSEPLLGMEDADEEGADE